MQHYIFQLGSGKPGEMGTHLTEELILNKLSLANKQIVFVPFHKIDHNSSQNDYKLFCQIANKFTNRAIILLELGENLSLNDLQSVLNGADLLVLGSGVCEPYLEFLKKTKLDKFIVKLFREKHINLMGYSAGSIALSHAYIHNLFYEEAYYYYKASNNNTQLLHEILKASRLKDRELLEKVFNSDDFFSLEHNFQNLIFQSQKINALNLLPEIVLLPHYMQSVYAMPKHLNASLNKYPWLKHYGIPNGIALVHSFDNGGHLETRVLGKNPNPNILLTRHLTNKLLLYKENEVIS